jgi:hypothetical protein
MDLGMSNAHLLASTMTDQGTRLVSIQPSAKNTRIGIIDPVYNKGPLFWYRLDASIRTELEQQYAVIHDGSAPPFNGDVLFGIAQTITGQKPKYLDRMLKYLTDAAKMGYSPARAVYAQIMKAHDQSSEFNQDVLDEWMLQAVSEGYFFASSGRLAKEVEDAKNQFRYRGGFCSDPFLRKSDVKTAIKDGKILDWKAKNGPFVDRKGNTLLHAAAALGAFDAVEELLDATQIEVDTENDNAETPLHKAFQAGHARIIQLLLDRGANASHETSQKITPLHWLFMIPENTSFEIAKQLIECDADVNAVMEPVVKENSGGFPEKIQTLH